MSQFSNYRDAYPTIRMERRDGILLLTFHSDGGPLIWGHTGEAQSDFAAAFGDIARDQENKVIIMTGTGDVFSGPPANKDTFARGDPETWEVVRFDGMQLMTNLLDIPAPVISCINGPAYRHPEIPLLADIVLAADDALIQDSAHFPNRTTPGDGVNVLFPLLMGWNRGRYFLLTGQKLNAQEMMELGLVNEVMPREKLLTRAWAHAETLVKQNPLVLRYTRLVLTQPLKMLMHENLGYSLALQGLAAVYESSGKVGYRWK